jgi:hypothetical protein
VTALVTRPPTGAVPWPLILVEGESKAGKSWSIAVLSASEKVGRTLWLDLAEGSADEYGAVPGARYEVVEHDGTWRTVIAQVRAARDEAARAAKAGEKPTVLAIDSVTAEWNLQKEMADAAARRRKASKGQRVDADTEVQITMDLWNEANARHNTLMDVLFTFPGIVIVTARGGEVAVVEGGAPTRDGRKEWKVDAQKNLAFDCTAWVRMTRGAHPILVGARSVHAGVKPGDDKPRVMPDLTLETLIFDVLKCDPTKAHVRDLPELNVDDLLAAIRAADSLEGLKDIWDVLDEHGLFRTAVLNEAGVAAPLEDVIRERIDTVKAELKREMEDAAPKSPADLARTEVAAWAQQQGIDTRDLNDRHVAAHGRGLGDEEDVDLIRAHMTDVAA